LLSPGYETVPDPEGAGGAVEGPEALPRGCVFAADGGGRPGSRLITIGAGAATGLKAIDGPAP
jgi:hypothetical protein